MIIIKTPREIELITIAGNMASKTHQYIKKYIKVGVTTNELNDKAEAYINKLGGTPSFKGYGGFPKAICISINDEVVHGIPSNYKLKDGDIVSLDIGVNFKGYHADTAWTYPVGNINEDLQYLLKHTKEALYQGIKQVKPGNRIGDISHAIETYINKYNLSIVKELVGHGVGNKLHEDPDIPNYGKPNTGPLIKKGMVIAIEPMINLGKREIWLREDNWTISTFDGKPSAHFEHTVLVTEAGNKILTGEWLNGK